MKSARTLFVISLFFLLSNCGGDANDAVATSQNENAELRWYKEEQVLQGAVVFSENCAICHGSEAQGLHEDWRQRLEDGSFPPPPLNGSAHAWHHPMSVLLQVINDGGEALGGKMPGFSTQLGEDDKLAAIAYFQSYWSDEIYANWQQMGGTN